MNAWHNKTLTRIKKQQQLALNEPFCAFGPFRFSYSSMANIDKYLSLCSSPLVILCQKKKKNEKLAAYLLLLLLFITIKMCILIRFTFTYIWRHPTLAHVPLLTCYMWMLIFRLSFHFFTTVCFVHNFFCLEFFLCLLFRCCYLHGLAFIQIMWHYFHVDRSFVHTYKQMWINVWALKCVQKRLGASGCDSAHKLRCECE